MSTPFTILTDAAGPVDIWTFRFPPIDDEVFCKLCSVRLCASFHRCSGVGLLHFIRCWLRDPLLNHSSTAVGLSSVMV